jgi:membrane-associated phospholipid phosphatase
MTSRAVGSRFLPRGWADLGRQVAIWLGFLLVYEIVSSFAGKHPAQAFANGRHVANLEVSLLHRLVEVSFQRVVDSSEVLSQLAVWTYWNSEFTVVGLALLWVYLRRHDSFRRFRNTILITDTVGLVIYYAMPTAPPRMFPHLGFADTLARVSGPSRGVGFLSFAANPYAAMPSLHAADALIVGIALALLVRNRFLKCVWLLWPVWVWLCVISTGNHFVLDVAAGMVIAIVCGAAVNRRSLSRLLARRPAAPAPS